MFFAFSQRKDKVGKPTPHLPSLSLFEVLDNFACQMQFAAGK